MIGAGPICSWLLKLTFRLRLCSSCFSRQIHWSSCLAGCAPVHAFPQPCLDRAARGVAQYDQYSLYDVDRLRVSGFAGRSGTDVQDASPIIRLSVRTRSPGARLTPKNRSTLFVRFAEERSNPHSNDSFATLSLESTDPASSTQGMASADQLAASILQFNLTYSGKTEVTSGAERNARPGISGRFSRIFMQPRSIVIFTGVPAGPRNGSRSLVSSAQVRRSHGSTWVECNWRNLFRAYGASSRPVPVDQSGIVGNTFRKLP